MSATYKIASVLLAVATMAALDCARPTPARAAAACTPTPGADTLLSIATCCAKDLSSNKSCRVYDKAGQYVIIKDAAKSKDDAYLIIPTAKVTGIEDSSIFKMPVIDFWSYGWTQSRKYPGQAPQVTGLAINSVHGRTQNQLHIHISCVRADVLKIVQSPTSGIGVYPAKAVSLQLPPHNNPYEVVKVTSLSGKLSPFDVILANPGVQSHIADQSIAVIGSQKANEYFVLNTYHHDKNPGQAEELLNQSCSK